MRISPLAWLNVAAKLALAASFAYYAARPELPQFAGKAMPYRTGFFPAVALLVLAIWLLRGRPRPYPHLLDALVTFALFLDSGGNAADLYRFGWYDHVVHFTNMVLFVSAFGMLLLGRPLGRLNAAAVALGFGAFVHAAWELMEVGGNDLFDLDLDTAYVTMMRDLGFGLGGSVLGALVVATLAGRRPELGGRTLAPRVPRSHPARPLTRRTKAAAPALAAVPLLLDATGNAADLYRFQWYGHVVHFLSMTAIAVAIGLLLSALPLGRLNAAALAAGLAAVLHTVWEVFQFALTRHVGVGFDVTRLTTVFDLLAGFAGYLLGGVLTGALIMRRRPPSPRASRAGTAR